MANKRSESRAITRIKPGQSGKSEYDVALDPITVGPDNTITIDCSRLATPARVYDADFAWVGLRRRQVSFFFAKRSYDDKALLRTRLEIRYPLEHFLAHFWKNSRSFHEALRNFAKKWPGDVPDEMNDPANMRATQEHSEWANFEAMAFSGSEGLIDFYMMPAVGVARYAGGMGTSSLDLSSVVRVQLSSFDLLSLLDSAEPMIEGLEALLPKANATTEQPQEEKQEGRGI